MEKVKIDSTLFERAKRAAAEVGYSSVEEFDAGGIEVITGNLRTADTDNPRGYYEFEKVRWPGLESSEAPAEHGCRRES